jgi:hypothetical protein
VRPLSDEREHVMLHKLVEAAARRLGVRGFSEARYEQAVDRMVAAYVDWRETSSASQEAYSHCDTTAEHSTRYAFAVYFAALDDEARAAAEYAARVDEVCALGSRSPGPSVTARAHASSAPSSARRSTEKR